MTGGENDTGVGTIAQLLPIETFTSKPAPPPPAVTKVMLLNVQTDGDHGHMPAYAVITEQLLNKFEPVSTI